jgi:hypothetical protein
MQITIIFRQMNGGQTTAHVEATSADTVEALRTKVHACFPGMPLEAIALYSAGRRMQLDRNLESYGVEAFPTVHLMPEVSLRPASG